MVEPLEVAVRNDPFFLVDRALGRNRRWLLIAVIAVINFIAFSLLPALTETQPTTDLNVIRLRLVAGAAWALVGVPTGLIIYFWLPMSLASLVPELRDRGLLGEPGPGHKTLDELDGDIDRRMGDGRWLILGVIAIGLSAATYWLESPRATVPPAVIVYQAVSTVPLVFGTVVLICRLVAGTAATVTLLQAAEVRVIPLHADDAGGWSPLGHRASVLGRAGAVYGLVAILVNVASILAGNDPLSEAVPVVTLLGFIALPPLVLWAWLFTPHREMLDARERRLAPIMEAFVAKDLAGIDAPAADNQLEPLTSGNDVLEQLTRRRELLMAAYPTWPMRLVELRAVWATALLPFVTGIVTALSSYATGWLRTP